MWSRAPSEYSVYCCFIVDVNLRNKRKADNISEFFYMVKLSVWFKPVPQIRLGFGKTNQVSIRFWVLLKYCGNKVEIRQRRTSLQTSANGIQSKLWVFPTDLINLYDGRFT